MEGKGSRTRICVFGHPSPASSMLKKMLEKHPQLDILGICVQHPPAWRSSLIAQPDGSFQQAYTHGPERLAQREDGDAGYSEGRRKATSRDETYQKAFDRLHKAMI